MQWRDQSIERLEEGNQRGTSVEQMTPPPTPIFEENSLEDAHVMHLCSELLYVRFKIEELDGLWNGDYQDSEWSELFRLISRDVETVQQGLQFSRRALDFWDELGPKFREKQEKYPCSLILAPTTNSEPDRNALLSDLAKVDKPFSRMLTVVLQLSDHWGIQDLIRHAETVYNLWSTRSQSILLAREKQRAEQVWVFQRLLDSLELCIKLFAEKFEKVWFCYNMKTMDEIANAFNLYMTNTQVHSAIWTMDHSEAVAIRMAICEAFPTTDKDDREILKRLQSLASTRKLLLRACPRMPGQKVDEAKLETWFKQSPDELKMYLEDFRIGFQEFKSILEAVKTISEHNHTDITQLGIMDLLSL